PTSTTLRRWAGPWESTSSTTPPPPAATACCRRWDGFPTACGRSWSTTSATSRTSSTHPSTSWRKWRESAPPAPTSCARSSIACWRRPSPGTPISIDPISIDRGVRLDSVTPESPSKDVSVLHGCQETEVLRRRQGRPSPARGRHHHQEGETGVQRREAGLLRPRHRHRTAHGDGAGRLDGGPHPAGDLQDGGTQRPQVAQGAARGGRLELEPLVQGPQREDDLGRHLPGRRGRP